MMTKCNLPRTSALPNPPIQKIVERSDGSFSRSFTLPEDAEEDKLAAEFKEEVLTVHLPKTAQPKPKSQEIKVS